MENNVTWRSYIYLTTNNQLISLTSVGLYLLSIQELGVVGSNQLDYWVSVYVLARNVVLSMTLFTVATIR